MFSDEEILEVFRESDHPFLGTTEVADAVGFSQPKGAYKRLEQLVEDGELRKRTVGGTSIYWLPARAD